MRILPVEESKFSLSEGYLFTPEKQEFLLLYKKINERIQRNNPVQTNLSSKKGHIFSRTNLYQKISFSFHTVLLYHPHLIISKSATPKMTDDMNTVIYVHYRNALIPLSKQPQFTNIQWTHIMQNSKSLSQSEHYKTLHLLIHLFFKLLVLNKYHHPISLSLPFPTSVSCALFFVCISNQISHSKFKPTQLYAPVCHIIDSGLPHILSCLPPFLSLSL